MSALPPGYTVIKDSAVGYSYLDEDGNIVYQSPVDSASARAAVWQQYRNRKKGK